MSKNKEQSFIKRIKISFILTILMPVLILGVCIIYFAARYFDEQRNIESNNIIEQNITDINNRIKACENSLRYLAANYDLQTYIKISDTSYDLQNKAQKNIGSLLYNVMLTNQYYKSIKIYTNTKQPILMEFFEDIDKIKNKNWYIQTINSSDNIWYFENDKIYISHIIKSSYPVKTLGVVSIEINSEMLRQSFNIFDKMPISISVENSGSSVVKYENPNFNNHIGYQKKQNIAKTGLYINYKIDNSYYDKYFWTGLFIPVSVIIICLFLTWILICFSSKRLVKDLDYLVQQVNIIQNGELNFVIKPSNISEVAILARSIQNLISRIKQLIDEVYKKEIKRQQLELSLLQSKIRPHFLYNNLSAINWLALECGQDKIYKIATELASYYRTSLNNGKNIDKLSVEISNIKSYLNLQMISHENSFNVTYDIDESLYEQLTPIFIMQPIVENAIEHGIDQLRNKTGEIIISVKSKNEFIIITIFDNGTKLFERIGNNPLATSEYGYGTSNVYKRITLLCGNKSSLNIYASEKGTTAIISFDKNSNKWLI